MTALSPEVAFLAVVACPLVALAAGALRPSWAARVGATAAAVATGALAWAWLGVTRGGDGTIVDVAWMPALGARLALGLDGLGATHAVLATGIGALVLAYSAVYLPVHLEHEDRPRREAVRFHALLLAFMASMVLLVTARDLLVVYVALDLTALASYFLIRFDGGREARAAALVAAVLTAGTSVLFLAGALLLGLDHGTLAIDELAGAVQPGPRTTAAVACIAAGVLAKSAQFPLHVWLPRAMVAPTPVSAYLHSAAMVAAGVFVLQRLHFLLELAPSVATALGCVAGASLVAGSALALVSDRLKVVLAYSTVAQYGYVLLLVAVGGGHGAAGAPLYVVVHGLAKSALFLTAGAVTLRTGAERLSETGGLARRMPVLAAASAAAAAGLAGLPLTAGFFKDELFFAATWGASAWLGAGAAAAAALTLGYTLRFWLGVFAGTAPADRPRHGPVPHRALTAPVVALASIVLALGFAPDLLAAVARTAGEVVARGAVHVELAYHLDARPENVLALAAWGAGTVLALSRGRWTAPLASAIGLAANALGPRRWCERIAWTLDRASDALHGFEVRDLRDRVGAILLVNAVFLVLGLVASASWGEWRAGELRIEDVPLALALAAAAGASLAVVREAQHQALVLMITFVGFGLALAFAFAAAPDVALVAVLVETTFTLLFLVLLARIRPAVLDHAREEARRSRKRDLAVSAIAAVAAVAVAWTALSTASPAERAVKRELVRRAEDAHAKDVVTAILTDFRGLDTSVEITVIVVALLGASAVRGRGRT